MLVISVVASFAAMALLVLGLSKFDHYCTQRFGYRFFTRGAFTLAVVALLCLTYGHRWWHATQADAADALNGMALMLIGASAALVLVTRNLRRTDLVIGSVGTALQISVFGVAAWIGMFALAAVLVLMFLVFGLGAVKPVWVINRR
jgi:hypothetical protein